jgi:hypothetical protein
MNEKVEKKSVLSNTQFAICLIIPMIMMISIYIRQEQKDTTVFDLNKQIEKYRTDKLFHQQKIDSLTTYADSCMALANRLEANRAQSDSLRNINLRKYEKQSRFLDTCGVDDLIKFVLQPK